MSVLDMLGEFEEFSEAKERADRWLAQIAHGAHRAPSRGTVRDALASYVRNLRSVGRRATAWDAGQRFRLTVGETAHLAVCGSRTSAARTSSDGETDFGAGVCLVP